MEQKLYEWIYKFTGDDQNFDFEIIPDKPIAPFDSLFKYYSLNKFSIESLKNSQFYVSQPHDFNDLFDSDFKRLDVHRFTEQDFLNTINSPKDNKMLAQMWKTDRADALGFLQHDFYKQMTSMLGIVCLTPNPLDELMWAYYNNNQGFCLEFDHMEFPQNFKGPFPINYIDFLQTIDAKRIGTAFAVILLLTTKKKIWSHENEMRYLVHSSNGVNFKTTGAFSNQKRQGFRERKESFGSTLKSITLGFEFLKNEEFTAFNDNEYAVRFVSNKRVLKTNVFDEIITRQLKCYSIFQHTVTYILDRERWHISKGPNDTYNITKED